MLGMHAFDRRTHACEVQMEKLLLEHGKCAVSGEFRSFHFLIRRGRFKVGSIKRA